MLVNAGQTLTERARLSGRMEAIVEVATGARYDFRQLNERTNQVANALLALGGVVSWHGVLGVAIAVTVIALLSTRRASDFFRGR